MKNYQASALIYFLIVTGFLFFLASLLPLPHYQSTKGWVSGPSFIARFIGEYDAGMPADEVYYRFIKTNTTSPFDLSCKTDADCQVYSVKNQCQVYCGNAKMGNQEVMSKLSNQRICDPAEWAPETLDCRCVLSTCMNIN